MNDKIKIRLEYLRNGKMGTTELIFKPSSDLHTAFIGRALELQKKGKRIPDELQIEAGQLINGYKCWAKQHIGLSEDETCFWKVEVI